MLAFVKRHWVIALALVVYAIYIVNRVEVFRQLGRFAGSGPPGSEFAATAGAPVARAGAPSSFARNLLMVVRGSFPFGDDTKKGA